MKHIYQKACLHIILCIVAFLPANTLFAQCNNADFETGTFANWQGRTGSCCPINTPTNGIVAGRHTIMTGAGTDPNTCGNVPVVAPGSTFSARLGNAGTNSEAERLLYTFTVTPQSALIIYKYAVVLENPSAHSVSEQPRFEVQVRDANGNPIPCTYYQVAASGNIPGFQSCSGVVYKNWTTVGVDVSAYIGQTVTLDFATGDCDLGAHFGYAYIDASCGPLQIDSRYCINNGQSVLTAPAGFTYLWNTGATTQSINITNPQQGQQFSCTLTSVTGCIATLNTTLSPSFTTANFGVTNNCMGSAMFNNTSIITNGSVGGYLWNFGDGATDTTTNPTHVYNNPGNYNITLIASNDIGCYDTISQPVTIFPTAVAAFNLTNVCDGQAVTVTDQSTIQQGAINQWDWDFGDNSTHALTPNGTHTYADTGSYNITLIASQNGNCPDTIVQPVSVKANPIANFTATDVCNGLANVFTNLSTTYWGNIAYNWNFGDNSGTSSALAPTYTYANPGAYTATLIVTQTIPSHTCADTIQVPLNVFAVPVAAFTSDQYLCLGEESVFTNQSTISTGEPVDYNWDFGDNTTSILQSPTHTYANFGQFTTTLIASTAKGCADTVSAPQNIYAIPVAGVAPDVVDGCEPLSVNYLGQSSVAAGNITGWNWDLGDGTSSNIQNPVLTYPYGTYDVEVVVSAGDVNNTCYDTATFTINSYAVPVANFISDQYLCLGEATVFSNQCNIASGEALAYSWDFGDNNTSAQPSPTYTYANYGTFTAELIATTIHGCADTVNAPQNIYAIPTATITPDITNGCQPVTVNYTGQGVVAQGNITGYAWDLGNNNQSALQNPSTQYVDEGSYTATLIVAAGDANNTCYDTTTAVIDVYPLPVADFSTTDNCFSFNTAFINQSTVSTGTIQNYAWDFGDNAGTSILSDPSYLYGAEGTYNVGLIVTTDRNCTDTIQHQVEIFPLPVVDVTSDTTEGCAPVVINFSDLSTVVNGVVNQWNWDFGDGITSTDENPNHVYENSGVYNVTLQVVSDHGCSNSYQFVNMITSHPNPIAAFSADPLVLDEITADNIGIDITNQSQGATVYNWTLGDGNTSTDFDPTVRYDSAGRYIINLYVENQWGCSDETSREITVTPVFTFYIPNAFTPNGNGTNDMFGGYGTNIKTYELYIFNRWGERIFTSYDMDNRWDGRLKDQRVQDEVYVYLCRVTDIFNNEHEYRGTVTLLK